MAKMNLFNSSCQADGLCRVYCKAQANLRLKCDNAVLARVKTTIGHDHIVWLDEKLVAQGIYSYVRAFNEPQEWADEDLSDAESYIFIRPDEDVFCFNRNTYFLYAMQNRNYQIRRLMAYGMQSVVEQIEQQTYEDKHPEAFFLSNFYTMDGKGRNYACTCWGISYKDGTNYLPVFGEDMHLLDEYGLSHFTREEITVGDTFKNNGYFYKLLQEDDGKLVLEQAKSVFLLGKYNDVPEPRSPQTAQIILHDFRKNI